jgi:Caspase domain
MNPRTHVFAVALEGFQDSAIPKVLYAENDAQKFIEAWQRLGVSSADTIVLLGNQATKTAFQSRLKRFLQNVTAGDRVIFFYAGHGVAADGEGFLAMYDTLSDDIEDTAVPVRDVLKQLSQRAGDQALLFLDMAHGGFPSHSSHFSMSDIRDFCDASPSRGAFVSCGKGEISYSSLQLRQGIWTHSVISALSGEAKESLDRGSLVTTSSLQEYLRNEVPRLLRANLGNGEVQTPSAFGDLSKDFVIADLGTLSMKTGSGASIKGSRLVGGSQGRVKSLSGFTKFHKEPDSYTPRFAQFVESLGVKEVEDRTTEIFERVRNGFKYKRKDLFFDKEGAIKTPDFDVSIRLMQDPAAPNMYLLNNEVTVLRRPEIVSEPAFLDIFARYCNSVIIELEGDLDIEAKIDDIEEVDALRNNLEYDAECTGFTLRFPGTGMVLHATRNRLRFTLAGGGDLTVLIAGTQAALAHLSGAHIALGLTNGSP